MRNFTIKKSLKKVTKKVGTEHKNAYLYINKKNKRYEKRKENGLRN